MAFEQLTRAYLREKQIKAKKTGESQQIINTHGLPIGNVLKDGSFYARDITGSRLATLVAAVNTNMPREKRNRACVTAWRGLNQYYMKKGA